MTMEEDKKDDAAKPATGSTKKKQGQPSASEESASPYPDMDLCQEIHQLTVKAVGIGGDPTTLNKLQTKVFTMVGKELENPSLYRHLQKTLGVDGGGILSDSQLKEMEEKHTNKLKELEDKVNEAKESAGDMEVMDARIEIARFAAKSLDKDTALDAYKQLLELPKISSGKKIDSLMESSRVASFYGDTAKSNEFIESVSSDNMRWSCVCVRSVAVACGAFSWRDIKLIRSSDCSQFMFWHFHSID